MRSLLFRNRMAVNKIAIIGSRGFPSTYGGYETLVRYVARRWVAQGKEVTVYCRQRPAHGQTHWHEEGVECIWTPGIDSSRTSTLSFGFTSQLSAMLKRFDAALLLNIANGWFLPLLAASGVPTVLNTDGIEWERGKWGPIARRAFYNGAIMSAKYADVLVCDSEAIGRAWLDTFKVSSRFIPYGGVVPTNLGEDRVSALGLRRRTYLLAVARLIPENNVSLTVDALESLSDRPPTVIVGSANYTSPFEQRLRKLDHQGTVRWLGHVSDQELLLQLWAHCGAYVHGHSVGGTNPALLQALGAGAPTIALDTPYNAEVIGSAEQLYPGTVEGLAMAMNNILSNQQLQECWSRRGQERVAAKYDWDRVCDDYLDALNEAKARAQASGSRRPKWLPRGP